MKQILTFFLIAWTIELWSQVPPASQELQTIQINEKILWENIIKSSPTVMQLEASFLGQEFQHSSFKDNFNTNFEFNGYYAQTKEKQLNRYVPVTSPIQQYSLGIKKNTLGGMQVGAKLYTSQTSNNFFTKGTTSGISAQIALDLYKDIGGKISKARNENLKLSKEISQIDSQIKIKSFFSNVRKLYWALVANNESMKLTQELIKHSQKQVEEALKRLKSRVADEGEVSQYQSQLASRQSQMLYLQYQRENIFQQIKEFLPDFSDKEIQLGKYNIDETVNNVLACTVQIKSFNQTPLDYTKLDELVVLLKNQYSQEEKITDTYSDMDLKLMGQYDSIGKDFSFSDSFTDLSDNGKSAFNVGLQLTIPLGSNIKDSREIKKKLDKKRYISQIDSNIAKMQAYHTQLVKSIDLLRKVVAAQKQNTLYLEKSLRTSQKKYNQARINVQQLVQEQDMYLQSSLQEIDVKTQVINTLLDYFSVFTETPCTFNEFKL